MSAQLSIVKAREKLRVRLWAGDCAVCADSQLTIAGYRLWRALREHWFHAQAEGRCLSDPELEGLGRELFSTARLLTIDVEGFTAWIAGVVSLTSPPSAPFITAVEAVSFLTRGAFLREEDIAAVAYFGPAPDDRPAKAVGPPASLVWNDGALKLFGKAGTGQITLFARKAPHFGGDPTGEVVSIPGDFFAGTMELGLFNGIYDRGHPERAMYREVMVSTVEFTGVFLAPAEPVVLEAKAGKPAGRHPTPTDEREFKAWADGQHAKRGYPITLKEAEAFSRERGLAREWARKQYQCLPDELRRQRGGKWSTRRLAKVRAGD